MSTLELVLMSGSIGFLAGLLFGLCYAYYTIKSLLKKHGLL